MLKLFNKGRIRGPVGFYQEKHTACNRKALQNDPKNVGKSQKILFEVSVTVSCFKITSELLKTTKWVEKPTKFQRIFFYATYIYIFEIFSSHNVGNND